jgi:hypothetical protein
MHIGYIFVETKRKSLPLGLTQPYRLKNLGVLAQDLEFS